MDIVMQEIWKPLRESSWYDVSNLGRVRSWRSRKRGQRREVPNPLKIWKSDWGVSVMLRLVEGDRRTTARIVAWLVADAFIGPRPEGNVCRHLNDDQWDNRVENLVWGTVAANWADARRNGKAPVAERHGCAKLSAGQVRQIRSISKRGEARRLAQKFGVSEGIVSMIRHGHYWKDLP